MVSLNRPLLKTALFSTFALICLAPLPQAEAQSRPTLVFTEWNDTTLTATLNTSTGPSYGTVIRSASDDWTWRAPASATMNYQALGEDLVVSWQEPPNSFNAVYFYSAAGTIVGLTINSDVPYFPGNIETGIPAMPNGGTESLPLLNDPNLPGGPSDPAGGIDGLTFIDEGDAPVPDQSSSLGLLFMAGLALLGGARLGLLQPC